MNLNFVIEVISNHGLPIFIVICYLYILYYIWRLVTKELKPALINILEFLNKLAVNVRTVENDMDKLNQKVTIITVIKSDNSIKD